MKLSIITASSGVTPEFAAMAKTLAATHAELGATALDVEWLLAVDKKLVDGLDAGPIKIVHVDPGKNGYNAALAKVTGEYVILLAGCSLPVAGWMSAVAEIVAEGKGFGSYRKLVRRVALPEDGLVRRVSYNAPWSKTSATTVPGPCWGAPKVAFEKVEGFDEDYQGAKPHMLDLCIRLNRSGVEFYSTPRAHVVTLRESLGAPDPREGYDRDRKNQALFATLLGDVGRIYPGKRKAPRPPPAPPAPPAPVVTKESPPPAEPAAESVASPPPLPGLPYRGDVDVADAPKPKVTRRKRRKKE